MTQPYSCPECKDTGVYQGLNTVEPCRACGGKKRENIPPLNLTASPRRFESALRKAGEILVRAARESGGQPLSHEISEQATESWTTTFTVQQLAKMFNVPEHIIQGKRQDEIMPAELEGLSVGSSVNVQIECHNCVRPIMATHRFIDRPLFGLPNKSFRIVGVVVEMLCHVTGKREVIAELLYKPPCNEDKLIIKNSAGEVISEQWLYFSDPCSDMLFVPILED